MRNGAFAEIPLDAFTDRVKEEGPVRRGEALSTLVAYSGPETGERALMRAVLQDAILCLQGRATGILKRNRKRAVEQAYRWVIAREPAWPFSFESICDVLGIEASGLRRRLLQGFLLPHDAAGASEPGSTHPGAMVNSVRVLRLRGNRRRGVLRLRQRRRHQSPMSTRQETRPGFDDVTPRPATAPSEAHNDLAGNEP